MITSRMNNTRIAPVEVKAPPYPPTFSLMLTPPLYLNTFKICGNIQSGLGETARTYSLPLQFKLFLRLTNRTTLFSILRIKVVENHSQLEYITLQKRVNKRCCVVFSYYRPYKKLFVLDFTCAVGAGLLELAFPVAVNKFIDDLLPGQDWSLILIASVALLAIYALNTAMNYVVTYWGHMLGINIETDMRKKCSIISRSSPSASSITIKPVICSVGLPMI